MRSRKVSYFQFTFGITSIISLLLLQFFIASPVGASSLSKSNTLVPMTPLRTPEIKTITLTSVGLNDGWILEKNETSNAGGSVNSTSTTLRLGDDNLRRQYRSVLSFKTASIPDNAVITSVKLKIKQQAITGGATFKLFQGLLVDIYSGTFGTAVLQTTDFSATASKANIGPFIPSPQDGWYTIDLTNSQSYFNKTTANFGLTQLRLRFKLDDNNNAIANFISFYSGNNPIYKPSLTIQYYENLVGPGSFSIDQTLSDNAQLTTIAFDGLAFITGDLGSDSFFPPGKVADFWGFQYLRDNDLTEMGHNTDFLTRASLNMLYVLSSSQKNQLISLAKSQVDSINEYGYERFVLMDAFRRLIENDLPEGTNGLNKDAVISYSKQLYRLDGEISYQRAQVMGPILYELDTAQKSYLDAMVGKGMLTWPVVAEPEELKGLEHDVKVAVMTYAGDLFSWYAGSLQADIYFCPERQGTYFGSFYMKDAPAVGNPGYTISSNLTAEMGNAFLKTLSTDQAALITSLVAEQKPVLYEIVNQRQEISILLRQFKSGGVPDQTSVLSQMELYGALDGEIVSRYAIVFAQVSQSLTTEQKAQLTALRTNLLGELAYPTGAYLFAQSIALPDIPNTDFLFSSN